MVISIATHIIRVHDINSFLCNSICSDPVQLPTV
ncbi:hypothetical protein SShM2_061 [Synechococcus phage S-ShM2]|uniref:Uncharacterized protein n=1 Tax=Synechococcus phage S-ShM2 TaxID=445683 RepID=E3SJW2_9CAUD|nr:hypothetical protein SShM2_061 [Synechococcus phage S-ShM2]ADO97672.1 hypothetical protein SShM2_061 [Synechococcus phage S-ShM2]